MKFAGECLFARALHALISFCSSEVAVSLSESGAFPLVRALVAITQRNASQVFIEAVAAAVAAMARFPDLHLGLILEGEALSFLAPLCVEDVGVQRQEASLGINTFSDQLRCDVAQQFSKQALSRCCVLAQVQLNVLS
jgi:hypothetical protein